jgi:nicotinamidase-related amidase
MHKNDCLVVIDMQPKFETSHEPVEAVGEMMDFAIRQGSHILIAKYKRYGKIHDVLRNRLADYTNWTEIVKEWDDGSPEIQKALGRQFSGVFHICGVNWQYCVKATATGLRKRYNTNGITVYPHACNGQKDESWHITSFKEAYEVYANNMINIFE